MEILRDLTGRMRELVKIWVDLFARHELLSYASAIAFQVLKSLVPLSLLGIALLGAIGRQDIWTEHMAPAIQSRLDPPVYHAIDHGVNKIFDHSSVGILVFAALLTVWYVSGGVRAIMGGMNRIYDADEKRPFWIRWLISTGLAVCAVAGIVGALLLVEEYRSRAEAGSTSQSPPAGSGRSLRSSRWRARSSALHRPSAARSAGRASAACS
jgi:uncharacterized BrkB/YihY/UPF0761 family membrane protein